MLENFRVNQSRVYVAGFSNGAMMAEILGCEAADVFAVSPPATTQDAPR
jgi:poly(3-hydroxybutyrate) depolymerase